MHSAIIPHLSNLQLPKQSQQPLLKFLLSFPILICRAEDTGFAAVKTGDVIEFRGYPEFSTFEEFGKCDHGQLIKIISEVK